MMLEELIGAKGDFTHLAGLEAGRDPMVDASAMNWNRADIVLTNLMFERVRLKGKQVRPNLVECSFDKCRFERIKSDNSFWGAGDKWSECDFSDVRMLGAISPANRFDACNFSRVVLEGYHPFDTVFEDCTFEGCTFTGLKAPYLTRKAENPDPELKILSTSVLFRNCKFIRTKFRGCYFTNIRFEGCTFDEPVIEHCDFTDCIANPKWWRDDQQGMPFLGYLEEVIDMVSRKLGSGSKAALAFMKVKAECERDPKAADHYATRVINEMPYEEMCAIEKEWDELSERYSE